MKKLLFITFLVLAVQVNAQIRKNRPLVWVIPSVDTRINGLAGGLIINSLKDTDSALTTEINGVSIELIGVGLLLPLAPSNPIYFESDDFYLNDENLDSIVKSYNYVKYRINGISISGGGIGGHDININGLNISGINTLIGKMTGLSICIMFNISGVVNGVSIGGIVNNSIQSKGLQIGLFNKTTRLRGFRWIMESK
ncbi:MAG: hypothetical protein U0T82_04200 [Bacteroidales bacterium]